ncbi:hypothetical protein OAS39_06885 [Pirellulales bacterium]|nr:hypothetical protein [Pirellulales bacterium]
MIRIFSNFMMPINQRTRNGWRHCLATLGVAVVALSAAAPASAVIEHESSPAMLQVFDSRWSTIENRLVDVFYTGYGKLWLPPPSRADSGDHSVGYDVYDRFDLGSAARPTLYGSDVGLQALVEQAHRASTFVYTDMILNHAGFSDLNTVDGKGTGSTSDDVTFAEAGGYPGLAITLPGDIDGDFHGAFESGDLNGRLAGLVDIAQEKNHQLIRHPVADGNPNNIPAGTAEAFGRIANVPTPDNARYYPDLDAPGVQLDVDLGPGQTLITRYNFNSSAPLTGDAVSENAEQMLMRHAQWMVQVIGVDGFRLDAVKHFPESTLDELDKAVFRTSNRVQHDGSIAPIYSFSEIFDGSQSFLNNYVNLSLNNRAGIDPSDSEVRGNRDALDFSLFFALRDNLTSNGGVNNWHNIRSASLDTTDVQPGEANAGQPWASNGSRGVAFVQSHDSFGPALENVAYTYTLMRPGNALVYFNAEEFGPFRDFPKDGKSDALGGTFGTTITKLVEIRNTHGRGVFQERWLDDAFDSNGFSNVYIYERSKSAVVGLNSRNDAFIETRNGVQTNFDPGTILVELTGNAADPAVDPGGLIPDTVKVTGSGQVNVSIPGNSTHGRGYVIYGVASPQGSLNLTNVGGTLAGETPSSQNNGTARLGDIDVIYADSFDVQLNTTPVSLVDPDTQLMVRDFHADGDTAHLKIDDGLDVNASAGIDFTAPGTVTYGFEQFSDVNSPGYVDNGSGVNIGTGSGSYAQSIDATQLAEGRHYLTVRAFRHRNSATGGDGGPAVFTDFKKAIYVDRLPPEAEIVRFEPFASNPNNTRNRDLIVNSTDQTASNMHFFLDLPANLTDAEVLQMALAGDNSAGQYGKHSWIFGFTSGNVPNAPGVMSGKHVATIVTFEPSFNQSLAAGYNVQRFNSQQFPGLFTITNLGLGFGDLIPNGIVQASDLLGEANGSFEDVLYSQNDKFNAAADLNGDGLVDNRDLFALGDELTAGGASQSALDAFDDLLLLRGDVNDDGTTDADDAAALYASFGNNGWLEDLNVDGTVDIADVAALIDQNVRTARGDFNLDRVVNGADFLILQQGFGTTDAMFIHGNADLNGVINQLDVDLFEATYGHEGIILAAPALAAADVVPEPSASMLFCVGAVCRLGRRSRRVLERKKR